MKALMIAGTIVGSFAATSQATDAVREGRWVLTPQTQAEFMPACRGMTLEFTADGRIIRTTGELVYTTTVAVTADSDGWLLTEQLESQNGKPGCGGKASDEIVLHLRQPAYIQVDGSVLRYYRAKNAKRVIEFERVDTKDAASTDEEQRR
jgi:hypothetical protein